MTKKPNAKTTLGSEQLHLQQHDELQLLGRAIQQQRKMLKVSVMAAAESAGVSRVTWHRMENGEPSVSAGAYFSALAVLGLHFFTSQSVQPNKPSAKPDSLPLKISFDEFPQLKQLAWQVHGVDFLSPKEAWSTYQRNWRHVEEAKLLAHEVALIQSLQSVFEGTAHV